MKQHHGDLAHFMHIHQDMKNTNTNNEDQIILLFEEDEQLRHSIRFTLKCRGYNVETYVNTENLLKIIENKVKSNLHVVLVITDLQLPGRCMYDHLKSLHMADYRIPILVIVGHGNREVRTELLKLGLVDIIDTPFCVEELITKVELMIKRL